MIMDENKSTDSGKSASFSNSDPLGIKYITLGGAPPSLSVEAQIASRQWNSQNGNCADKAIDD
jgi:hypothetical protein